MTCSFTVDNRVDSATYNENTLTIAGGNLGAWSEEKTVTFESCDDSNPGTLMIKGYNVDVEGIMFTFFVPFWQAQPHKPIRQPCICCKFFTYVAKTSQNVSR